MGDNSHILFAYKLDGKGGGERLEGDMIEQELHNDESLVWVHLDANFHESRRWIEKEINYLDAFILEALLDDDNHPRALRIDDSLLLILRGVNLNEESKPEDMISVRMWIDGNHIITLRRRRLKAIWDIVERIDEGNGPTNSGEFVAMITDRLLERMEPTLNRMDDDTDIIEEAILDNPDKGMREKITGIRKQAIMLRRYFSPQREAIRQVMKCDLSWLDDKQKRQMRECQDTIERYIEDLDAVRERTQIIKDELVNLLSDKLNKNLYILSIISAIFLPLGFLTGLLGINVGGIPGAEDVHAFWIFLGVLAALVFTQVVIFKIFRWF